MTFLPIVVRQLRVAARHKSTYRVRFCTAFGAVAVGSYLVFVTGAIMGRRSGSSVFTSLTSMGYLGCLLLAANTADCISEEKREGTLGFLFLTDLRGYDIALGKLFSSSLVTFYLILGILPIVALSLLLGGVTAREFWEVALALLNVFFFSQSAGILISTLSRKRNSANSAVTLLLLFYTVGLLAPQYYSRAARWSHWIPMLGMLNPGFSVYTALAGPSGDYWTSLLLVHLNAWIFLALASWRLPHCWQEKAAKVRIGWPQRLRRWYHARFTPRKDLLDTNPFLWLSVRNSFGSIKMWTILAALGCFWIWTLCRFTFQDVWMPVFFTAVITNHLLLKMVFASEATNNLEEQRHSGALEFLLSCTPLTVQQIIDGQWRALLRQFLWPTVAVVLADFAALSFVTIHSFPGISGDDKTNFTLFVLALIAMLILDLYTLGWVGMWKAMSKKKRRHAAGAAVSQILLLPWVLLIFCSAVTVGQVVHSFMGAVAVWFFVGIVIDVASLFLSRDQLISQFRARAAVQSEEPPGILDQLHRAVVDQQ